MKKAFLTRLIGVILILIVIFELYLRFRNPDMTNARFLIQFWPLEITFLVVALIFLKINRK